MREVLAAVFLRIPATGKSATWTEIQFFRFWDGKVAEHWVDSRNWASSHRWAAEYDDEVPTFEEVVPKR